MKKVLAYLPLHFAVLLILGILCQFYFKIWTLSIPFIKLNYCTSFRFDFNRWNFNYNTSSI